MSDQNHHHVNHEKFAIKTVGGTHGFADSRNRDVVVDWVYDPGTGTYSVTIKRDWKRMPKTVRPYSLYNLAVQNRNWGVHIKNLKGKKARILDSGGEIVRRRNKLKECDVPYTGWLGPNNAVPMDANIWFIYFEGTTCTFDVRADRRFTSNEMQPRVVADNLSSHNEIPPLPQSGNEY